MYVRWDLQKFASFCGINSHYVFIFYCFVNFLLLLFYYCISFYYCLIDHLPFSNYDNLWILCCCNKGCKCVTFTTLNLTPKYRILKYLSKSNTQI